MVWTLQQLENLCGQPSPNPAQVEALALELASFFEHCPADFLEALLASPFGRCYQQFLDRCCLQSLAGPAATGRRDQLSQRLRASGFQGGEGQALLLALMPFFPPGNLKVEDAAAKLPAWLHGLYQRRYEPSSAIPAGSGIPPAQPSGHPSLTDRIFLNRMLGLSNLYYIDPEDQEILQELRQVRLQVVNLLLGLPSQELAQAFQADFGDRYWAMAQSGVQKEPLDAAENERKQAIQHWLSTTPNSLATEGGIQRFAAALLFNPPGSVRLAAPEQNLPGWFLSGYQRYCSIAVAA